MLEKLEPELKGKPYAQSLRKFLVAPLALEDKKSLEELLGEARDNLRRGRLEEARKSYHLLVGTALALDATPGRQVRRYLAEYMNFIARRRLSSSEYHPTRADFMAMMNHLDEILKLVRDAYKKPEVPKAKSK
ncbi:MAG: hypothetical protein NZ934_00660 [Hadesarchaea archaeon]|nr:hypothetical protein [Hadesarchaea archaeon]